MASHNPYVLSLNANRACRNENLTTFSQQHSFRRSHRCYRRCSHCITSAANAALATILLSIVCLLIGVVDCSSSTLSNNPASSSDRVFVVKQPNLNPSYKQTKQSFKENFEKLTIHVKENTPIGTKLTDIQPREDDAQHGLQSQQQNDKILFAIIGGTDQQSFTLRTDSSTNKVELVNEVNFDYESDKKNYQVLIRASSLYLRYEVEVDISVTDENDNRPMLEDFAIVFNNYKNNFPTGPIGRVPASDLDLDDVLHYRIVSGNNAQLIVVNETNGDITLSPWLNSNVPLKAVMDVVVSDGINEVTAKLVLTVNLITEAMLHNSVVLRLDGIGRDEFFTRKYELFLGQMARILYGTEITTSIVVFDVEQTNSETLPNEGSNLRFQSYHGSTIVNSSMSLNVSFSVRAPGQDVEAYLSNQLIEERIFLTRAQLSQSLDVKIAPFQDNLCVREPCQNYQECQATYKFDKAPKIFYTSKNMIFRPIKATQSFMCSCPPTFTGMKHKTECNLQINQCFSNPCLNDGICHRHESGYTCECKQEFFGQNCEHSLKNSTCQSVNSRSTKNHPSTFEADYLHSSNEFRRQFGVQPNTVGAMCSGKSRCVNLNKFSASNLGKPTTSLGGFTCQGCPYPQWSTDLCQLRARSFEKNSYITLPSLRRRHRFHIMLEFTTTQNDALLLYNGRYNDKNDFIALEIVDSRLRFSYSLGTGVTSVSLPSVVVSNGDWHKASIDYRDRNVTITVDDCDPIIDEALARIQGSAMRARCSNTSYTTEASSSLEFRMLDLASPMHIGSLPAPFVGEINQPTHAVQSSFVGCIKDIHIDHQLVDLSTPIHDFETQPGCPEKRALCQSTTCNGSPCQDTYGVPKCLCSENRLGRLCEHVINQEKVRKFNGNSYLSFNPIESTIPANWVVSLHFRTIQPNGILLKISLEPESSIMLELMNGGLKLTHRLHSLIFNKLTLDDGEWHHVEIIWVNDSTMIQLDHNSNLAAQTTDLGSVLGSSIRTVVVGASTTRFQSMSSEVSSNTPTNTDSSAALVAAPAISPETTHDYSGASSSSQSSPIEDLANIYSYGSGSNNSQQSFVGCIYALNISDNVDWWTSPNDERNVERGCPVADVCESNPCPANSHCMRRGLNHRKCICNPGFVGEHCTPVCDLSPCQGDNSRCIPAVVEPTQASNSLLHLSSTSSNIHMTTSMSQYTCECEQHRSGKNCEYQLSAKCPSNWWGKPIFGSSGSNSSLCGPCNCDESKGFDGDCDKTNGQCFCKASHYQPPGSDYCLPCDCYMVGSLGSSCNQTSGQCKCRPGVVGRRCDTCTGLYAEVTLRGCEVIYDACPKTYSDGIWWEKTQYQRLATQPCPVATSTGAATRFCDKTEGWQKANLFDCISNTFTDLYTHYRFLEDNKFQMTTGLPAKIANSLRSALNETISNPSLQLYGSDMYISFRLLHLLVEHDSHQTGFNLTHRQDRSYIRNLAESISYLLEPSYADNWPEISRRSPNGGAEHLLRLMDSYGKILIESQSDTFTMPFEVSTKYFTFGMDTLTTEQLWDLGKWSPSGTSSSAPVVGTNGILHFPSSPPYATDPFEPSLPSPLDVRRHNELGAPPGQFNSDGTSIYLDFGSNARDSLSASIMVPKYDNYAASSSTEQQHQDVSTRALIPLRALKIKSPQEMPSFYNHRHLSLMRAKRDELLIPDIGAIKQASKPALVAYSIFNTLGRLLPNKHDNTVQNRFSDTAEPNAPVIWLTLRPANSSEFLTRNIQPKITYTLKMLQPVGKSRPQCAFWDFSAVTSSQPILTTSSLITDLGNKSQIPGYGLKQTGRFTTKGCELKGVYPNSRVRQKYEYVNCSCDHLGAVTVLMDDSALYDHPEESSIADYVLTIALSVSLFILIGTLFVLSCIRCHSIKSNSNSINKNLLLIMIMIELFILYTVMSRSSLYQHVYQCKLVAIFLQYFSISLFFWLAINAVHFYRMLTEVRDINHGPLKFYYVLGYAVPAVFVCVAVGLKIEHYGNHLFCWLSIYEPIIWSMFGPISVASLFTIVVFKLALCKSLPLKDTDSSTASSATDLIKSHMLINIVKTPTIGIYWLIAIYAVNESLIEIVYLFPVLVVVKSLVLFVLLCIIDKYIRYNLYVSWLRFNGKKAPFVEEQSANYLSPQWMSPYSGSMMMPATDGTMYAHGVSKNNSAAQLYGCPSGANLLNQQAMTPGFQGSCTDIFRPELLAFSAASTTSRSSATGTSSSIAYGARDHSRHRARDRGSEVDADEVDDVSDYGRSRERRGHRRTSRHKRHHKHHHHRHHKHHHHHHHRHHKSHYHHRHRDGNDDGDPAEEKYGRSRRHYERTSQQNLATNSQGNSQQELASSHSSDATSLPPPAEKNLSSAYGAVASPKLASTVVNLQEDSIPVHEEEQQTVPMELLSPSTSGLQTEE